MMSPLGFKARVHSALIAFAEGEYHVHSPRSTSGATPADLLTASIAAGHFPACIRRDGSWLRFERAITRTVHCHCISNTANPSVVIQLLRITAVLTKIESTT